MKGGVSVRDEQIVELFWRRDESAIQKTEQKYGPYLTKIAYNILSDWEDSKESVNDTYLKAWSSMPPHKPDILSAYLGKITRQVSIDILRKRSTLKRQASEYAASLDEIGDCIPAGETPERTVELELLAEAIASYLRTLSPQARNTFIGRYYFMDSIRDITEYYGMSKSKVESMLHRTRKGLKAYLEKEGYTI